MHRDAEAMNALRAQVYRQYQTTGLFFGHVDIRDERVAVVSYPEFVEEMKRAGLRPTPSHREMRTLFEGFKPNEDERVSLKAAVEQLEMQVAQDKEIPEALIPDNVFQDVLQMPAEQPLQTPAILADHVGSELEQIQQSLTGVLGQTEPMDANETPHSSVRSRSQSPPLSQFAPPGSALAGLHATVRDIGSRDW